MLSGHHWRALGALGAAAGATTVILLHRRGYSDEAQVLTMAGLLAGGIASAVALWTAGEQEQAAQRRLLAQR